MFILTGLFVYITGNAIEVFVLLVSSLIVDKVDNKMIMKCHREIIGTQRINY